MATVTIGMSTIWYEAALAVQPRRTTTKSQNTPIDPATTRYACAAQVEAESGTANASSKLALSASKRSAPTAIATAFMAAGCTGGNPLTTIRAPAQQNAPARIASIDVSGTSASSPLPKTAAIPPTASEAPTSPAHLNGSCRCAIARPKVSRGTQASRTCPSPAGARTSPQ
jgi:hypothetical protein